MICSMWLVLYIRAPFLAPHYSTAPLKKKGTPPEVPLISKAIHVGKNLRASEPQSFLHPPLPPEAETGRVLSDHGNRAIHGHRWHPVFGAKNPKKALVAASLEGRTAKPLTSHLLASSSNCAISPQQSLGKTKRLKPQLCWRHCLSSHKPSA